MENDPIKNLVEQMIPFVKKTGVLVDDLTSTKVRLTLPHDPTNLNPMGTLHAGALFTLAETAAAALCLMALGPSVMFIAKSVEIRFRRAGKGDVVATAQMTPVEAQRVRDGALKEGKLDAPVSVEVTDPAGEPVVSATVTMSVRRLG